MQSLGRLRRKTPIDSSVFNNVFITMAFPGQLGLLNPGAKLTLRIEAESPVVPFCFFSGQTVQSGPLGFDVMCCILFFFFWDATVSF